ncbi:MAG: serine/threonine-protein phosphatase [Chloroflexi bacterium]|nr:serine/threonine-protein phosphatase [Chloroflexota bacterium]
MAKTKKYGSLESGDTLEIIERPSGGLSAVMADAQLSGKEGKALSSMVVRKVISLLAEGVRDGAASRAASDHLFTDRGAQPVCLNILSADLETNTIVISRNNPTPMFIAQRNRIEFLNAESEAIGISRNVKPTISEIPLESNTLVVMYTDGLLKAGALTGESVDICTLLESFLEEQDPSPQLIADTILAQAIRLDQNRPSEDMSLVVLRVVPQATDQIRRMCVSMPVMKNIDD